MTEDPKRLEREIDHTRHEMDDTIDALSERLNVRNMSNRAMHAVMRKAPTPPDAGRSFYNRKPIFVGSMAFVAGLSAGFLLSPPATGGMIHRSSGPGIVERAKETMQHARERISEAGGHAKERLAESGERLKESASPIMSEAGHQLRDTASGVGATLREAGRVAADETREGVTHVREAARDEAKRQNVTPSDLKERVEDTKEAGSKTGTDTKTKTGTSNIGSTTGASNKNKKSGI